MPELWNPSSHDAPQRWTKETVESTEELPLSATTSKAKLAVIRKDPSGNSVSSLGHKAFVERMRRLSEVERRVTSDFDRAVDRTAERLSLEMREKKRPSTR